MIFPSLLCRKSESDHRLFLRLFLCGVRPISVPGTNYQNRACCYQFPLTKSTSTADLRRKYDAKNPLPPIQYLLLKHLNPSITDQYARLCMQGKYGAVNLLRNHFLRVWGSSNQLDRLSRKYFDPYTRLFHENLRRILYPKFGNCQCSSLLNFLQ